MERLKTAFGRFYNPVYVRLAGMLLILVIVAVGPGVPDAGGWP